MLGEPQPNDLANELATGDSATDMKIEPVPFDLSLIRGSIPVSGDSTRSSGLHVSDIIASLNEQVDPLPPELLDAYAALGFVVEQIFEYGIAHACLNNRYIRIGELELDGIAGSPDIVDVEEWAVVDTKAKWCSSKHAADQESIESKFRKEIWQLKAYCHMLTRCTDRECHTAQLWMCFVNGDYREIAKGVRCPPHWIARRFTFTAAELVDNWAMLKEEARRQGWL